MDTPLKDITSKAHWVFINKSPVIREGIFELKLYKGILNSRKYDCVLHLHDIKKIANSEGKRYQFLYYDTLSNQSFKLWACLQKKGAWRNKGRDWNKETTCINSRRVYDIECTHKSKSTENGDIEMKPLTGPLTIEELSRQSPYSLFYN